MRAGVEFLIAEERRGRGSNAGQMQKGRSFSWLRPFVRVVTAAEEYAKRDCSTASGLHFFDAFDESLEFARPRRMPQLAQCLGFNLPDALARYLEALAHFFERML